MTADVFCTLLARSKLHPPEAVKQQFERWQAEAKGKTAAADLAAWLVSQKLLTEYQANQLLNKKPDHLVLGEYKLLDRIGKERIAGIYKAVHSSGQVVALKILPPSKAKQLDTLARFQREAKLATQLNHPNVVRTFHIAETAGIHYLVMELLDGETLGELLKQRGRLPAKEAVRVAFLAALGLQHIHEKGLVHRDLKPGNLLLVPAPGQGENTLRSMVKIVDIGLGKAMFETKETGDLTLEGEVVGTPDYLAPEQARDARKADIRSDIYGLGCTLYHALTGQPPFPDNNPTRQVLRHATEQVRPLKDFTPDAPDGLQTLVATMLAKEPAQRYQTPTQVADALKSFLAHESEPAKLKPVTAEMRDYQDWLNKEMTAPTVAAAAAEPSGPVPMTEDALVDKRGRKKSKEDVPVARSALVEIDVEPVDLSQLRPRAPFGLKIPRDLFMILVGAVSVLGIVTIIWLITYLVGAAD
jgi:eukaryotic-like serine/threonine-protein kinase